MQIQIQSHAGARAPDMFLGCAPAQAHNGAAILLCFRALGIKEMADVIDANNIGHVNHAGFGIHFNLDKMRLPAHRRTRFESGFPSMVRPVTLPTTGCVMAGSTSQNMSATSLTVFRLRRIRFFENIAVFDIQVFGLLAGERRRLLGFEKMARVVGRRGLYRIFQNLSSSVLWRP